MNPYSTNPHSLWRSFKSLIKPFWVSEEKWKGFGILAVVIALSLGLVYLNVLFNQWNNVFYNSLQNLDAKAFRSSLIRFTYLALSYISVAVYAIYCQQMLEVRWRRWLTGHFVSRWLNEQSYYRLQLTDYSTDNPDQRIAEDVTLFVRTTLSLTLGLLRSVITLVTFITILWGLSGPLRLSFSGHAVSIPAYMVWAAIIYAFLGTVITMLIGRRLVHLSFLQQRFEADFRFGLIRIRENAESVALYRGEKVEGEKLKDRFSHVVSNFWRQMKVQKQLNIMTNFWGQLAIIFPILVAAPRLFSHEIMLGGLMQIASAFGQVYDSLQFIISSFVTLADWKAVIDRLHGFGVRLDRIDDLPVNKPSFAGTDLQLKDLDIAKPDGTRLMSGQSLTLVHGDRLLVRGVSGCGKSTLLRALSGIWPYMNGAITYPENGTTLFLSQKPYLPLGSLRQTLYYPLEPVTDDSRLPRLLDLAGLNHLAPRLDETDLWSHILSVGEQQRVAFVRALLVLPDILFLDEASSALDIDAEKRLYSALVSALPRSIIVSVGHRESLTPFHTRILFYEHDAKWIADTL